MSAATKTADDQTVLSPAMRRRFLTRLIVVLLGGMFLDGYILGIIGPISGTMADELQISAFWEGLIAAAALVGIFIGGPIGGGPPTSGAGNPYSPSTSRFSPSPRACSCSWNRQSCSSWCGY